jgi:S1-C subfamily serine protease
MLYRVMKPFIFLALLVALISTACLNTGTSTPASVPEKTQSNEPTQEKPATEKPSSSSTGAVNNIDDVKGAVFQIIGTGTLNTVENGEQLNAEWGGTGFFIDSSGIGVTNNHVVAGAALLKAYVNGETKARNITVLGTSECADLAVVKVEGSDFPFLSWYDGTVKTGLDVYAAGFPLAEPEYNLTKGIVSKVDADGQTYWASLDYIYGHDAKINGGNSGGPLVTEDGKVVGINYMSRASVDQQFAIPGDLAIPIVKQLQTEKNVASIGLAGSAVVFGPNGEYPGIWVESTTTGGIADKAGILPGDIIHEVETILIATDGTMKDYCDILRGHKEGDPLKVMVYRSSTDEILEGTLNGDKLVSTGVAGLSGAGNNSNDNTNPGTTTYNSGDTIVSTTFDDTTGWSYYAIPSGNVDSVAATQRTSRVYLEVKHDYTEIYFLNDLSLSGDLKMTANVETVAGPNTNNISLVCRYSDAGFYEFSMSSGGMWWIWKYDGNTGTYKALAKGGSTAIRVMKAPNELAAQCFGEELTFWINGKKVGTASDPDFNTGLFGIGVYADKIKGVGVDVNDFEAVVP